MRFALKHHPFGRATLTAMALSSLCFGVIPGVVLLVAGTGPVEPAACVRRRCAHLGRGRLVGPARARPHQPRRRVAAIADALGCHFVILSVQSSTGANVSSGTGVVAAKENLRKVLLQGSDAVGRATSGARVLPDLLICGGQRCGTTSMYKALVQQPTIFRPVWRKGVHYFDMAYEHDLSWYRSHFPLEAQLSRAAKRHETQALSFESSPYYLFHPLAADRIAADLPGRHAPGPGARPRRARATRAHAHEFARGFETLGFEAALDAEEARLHGRGGEAARRPALPQPPTPPPGLPLAGEYAVQLDRIAALIGRDRIKVVDSHRFFTDPEPLYADVLSWLGSRPVVEPTFDRHNARGRVDMPESVRAGLEQHFAPHDAALESWLGHVPSWRA